MVISEYYIVQVEPLTSIGYNLKISTYNNTIIHQNCPGIFIIGFPKWQVDLERTFGGIQLQPVLISRVWENSQIFTEYDYIFYVYPR
jgi:hypothetical protein